MRISTEWFVADFETTGVDYYEQYGCTKVWLWAVCDKEANIDNWGGDIESFIAWLKKHTGKTIYFHNLKFDGSFLVDYLLKNGYTYTDKISNTTHCINPLIGDMGQWYSMKISFSKGKYVTILDSLKVLPFKVEQIAKDFNLPILKGKIDYNDYNITEEKLSYVFNDVRIVAMALKAIKAEGMTKMTTASCAYHEYSKSKTAEVLRILDPELDKEFLIEWRNAYRGGRSQVNPYYAEKILHNVYRYDINSMYPWVMYTQPMPYGRPIKCTRPGKYSFELYKLKISFTLKRGHLPCILKKSNMWLDDSYYVDSDGIIDLWISSPDFTLLKRHYKIDFIQYETIWGFYTSKELFKEYIDKWYGKKQIDEGAKRIVDKLMLNSLYGKFGSNCEGKHKIPTIEDNKVKYIDSEVEDMKKYYLPRAIAVTSWAHLRLDDGIEDIGVENFIYCDTDSIHSLKQMSNKLVDNKELGKYKLEAIEDVSKYIRQKTYIYHTDKEGTRITCAGMTDKLKEEFVNMHINDAFEQFRKGLVVTGKLLPKRVNGGTILYETTFEIKQ